jgi:hypothetical protein
MAREPGTVVLDARSPAHFQNLHVKGSVNLPYTEFSAQTLAKVIPDRGTRVLIYCRNNLIHTAAPRNQTQFDVSPPPTSKIEVVREFVHPDDFDPPKIPQAGLNIPTFITLMEYGYHNVWELDSRVDPRNSPITFE